VARFCINFTHGIALGAGVADAAVELVLASETFPWKQAKEIHEAVSQRLRSGDSTSRTRFTFRTFRIHATFPLVSTMLISVYFLFRS
jgi:hypothetical protein